MNPSEPPKPLGWSNGKWAAVIVGGIVALVAINYAFNHEEIARRMAQANAEQATRDAEEVVQAKRRDEIWKVKELGRRLGKADGAEIGAKGVRKPSLEEIRLLCVSRAVNNGIDKMDKEKISEFWLSYEEAFKGAYKSTADW